MNLNKKCRNCGEFFKAKLLELKFYCDKEACKERERFKIIHIKRTRGITMDLLDIYDLDRPIMQDDGKVFKYERVCRTCGSLLLNKDGKYSYHKRYCNKCSGSKVFEIFNWSELSKRYARKIQRKQKKQLLQEVKKRNIEEKERYKSNLILCEKCEKLCQITDSYWDRPSYRRHDVINIHHKIPVHSLTFQNLYLIWSMDNLIALCPDCHNKQDHLLKTKVDPFIYFRKITEFLNGV